MLTIYLLIVTFISKTMTSFANYRNFFLEISNFSCEQKPVKTFFFSLYYGFILQVSDFFFLTMALKLGHTSHNSSDGQIL